MSKSARDWNRAMLELRDLVGENVDPTACVSLGRTSPERLREWARRLEISMRRVLNVTEMWAREEAREGRRLAK